MIEQKEEGGIHWLQFSLLSEFKNLQHAVFLKSGGLSTGPFHSLNLSNYVGDQADHVAQNLKRVAKTVQLPSLIWNRQCHSKDVIKVDVRVENERAGDALATDCPHVGLMVLHADCQAAIIYDPIHHAVANVHSGWRGTVKNIYAETIRFMQHIYHSNPQELLVCIGPSLEPDYSEFVNYREELPAEFWQFQCKPCYFDFWAISEWQLKQCGVLPHHIEIARIGTYGNPNDYFSYRFSNITGRHGTVVALL